MSNIAKHGLKLYNLIIMKLGFSSTKASFEGIKKKSLSAYRADWGRLLIVLGLAVIVTGIFIPYRIYTDKHTVVIKNSSASNGTPSISVAGSSTCGLQTCTSTKPTTTATTSGSTPATTSPTPTPTPSEVPQTALNNDELNAKCYNAQSAYDVASVQIENATQTAIQSVQALENTAGLSETVTQENQIYTTANTGQSQDYNVYLSAVHAIPGCAVDFQFTPYPLLPVPTD